jgi:uncharacterized cupin superfamily protein
MSDYTLLNLLETDDDAAKHGIGDTLEAHFPREALGCEKTGVSLQRIRPGRRLFGHTHKTDEEIYVVLSGAGTALLGEEQRELKPMDTIRVAPATLRAFKAGPEGLELLVFGTHTPDDTEMHPDPWGD